MVSKLLGIDDMISSDKAGTDYSSIKKKKRTPSSVDVVIVGAGYSGLYSARQLARAGYSVAVVR
jgi:ribulose 1,5-bisphosphate synthetase/thiazole synthase